MNGGKRSPWWLHFLDGILIPRQMGLSTSSLRTYLKESVLIPTGIWVNKSKSKYRNSNLSKRLLAIFWDMESCSIPNGVDPEDMYANILACLRYQTEIEWEVTMFSAYANFENISPTISEGCMKARTDLKHVPNGINDNIGKAILVDLCLHAHDNPPPSSIMLISGDVGFSHALHRLHQRQHPIIFVIPSSVGVSRALSYAAIDVWDWSNVVRGEGHALNKPSSEYIPDDVMPVQHGDLTSLKDQLVVKLL